MHIRCRNLVHTSNADFTDIAIMVKLNLPRGQRSILSKLYCGILPLELEVGRYRKTDREIRYCKLCSEDTVEDEGHFLFECDSVDKCRSQSISPLLESIEGIGDTDDLDNIEKLKILCSKEHLKDFASALELVYYARQEKVHK